MHKIFIDGEHGTTGLQIRKHLEGRADLEILSLPEQERRNFDLRVDYLRAADVVILCLPDSAAIEAVGLLDNHRSTRIIDSSTAFRTHSHWVYGFAEMCSGQAERIGSARLVANPGCYPTGAVAMLRPLREAGMIGADYPVTINAVSGYSGGGKQLIAQMEESEREDAIHSPHFLYGLGLAHKHLPEIVTHGLLSHRPVFTPQVGRFSQGMLVNLPLHQRYLSKPAALQDLYEILAEHYQGQPYIEIVNPQEMSAQPRIDAGELVGTNRLKIYISGDHDGELFNLTAVLDNLGKGASGAAVQNLNLMLERFPKSGNRFSDKKRGENKG